MAARFTDALSIAILLVLVLTLGVDGGILAMAWLKDARAPGIQLGIGQPPVPWQGGQPAPSANSDICQSDGFDSCSDRHEDEDPTPLDDNDPIPV